MEVSDIVGAWRLVSFFAEGPDGRRVFPYGEDAQGFLVYAADGWMSAVLSRVDRGDFGQVGFAQAARASEADKARAFDGYTSYAGRYRIDGDTVEHTVACSLVPTMVGKTLRRRGRFEDETLVLDYDVQGRKHVYRYELRWSRP